MPPPTARRIWSSRLDRNPELLFTLRSVNHEELITQAATAGDLAGKTRAAGPELAESEISAVFGIELDTQTAATTPAPEAPPVLARAKPRRSKTRKPAPAKKRNKANKSTKRPRAAARTAR
jgi:hypothetical protein